MEQDMELITTPDELFLWMKGQEHFFDQTHYGKQIDDMAKKWADELIAAARGGREGIGKLMKGAFRELDEGRAR